MLEDVQSRFDGRNLPIGQVGISGFRYPVTVWDQDGGSQSTVAEFSMSVALSGDVKGAHLSRFVEVLHDCAGELSPHAVPVILEKLRQRLGSSRAELLAEFPYFMLKEGPVTDSAAMLEYKCQLSGCIEGSETILTLAAGVPVTSVCPCSKAISDYGAHNQRGHITLRVQPRNEGGGPVMVWIKELIEIAEASASSPVFPLLKRPDERYVTMHAYDHPVFVEDMARAAASALCDDGRVAWFSVEAANDESIHNHAAFARIDSRYLPVRQSAVNSVLPTVVSAQ
jgi:GTP cyclohydrolase FolE2